MLGERLIGYWVRREVTNLTRASRESMQVEGRTRSKLGADHDLDHLTSGGKYPRLDSLAEQVQGAESRVYCILDTASLHPRHPADMAQSLDTLSHHAARSRPPGESP